MKLVFSSNGLKWAAITRRILFYSTETLTRTSKGARNTLYSRISPVGTRASVLPVLNQWRDEGNTIKRIEIVHMIKQLRVFKKFHHALQISQWMSDRGYFVLSPGDFAVRLDLIYKVHGIEQAEKYFDNIPKESKIFPVYNALLNCYSKDKSIVKAESLMQQMRELEFDMSPLAYNVLLNLYSQVKQYDKLDILMEEMIEKGVHPDKFTLSIRLSAYTATSDIDGMEKILQRMEEDPKVIMDWNCYAIAANGYIKAGIIDKALDMLKKSEKLITGKKKSVAYDFLLTMYAGAGSKDDMYRIWSLYKSSVKVYNSGYICMIRSLLKLDDVTGAEKVMEEWESGDTCYDFRIPSLLIAAYCESGLLEKAEKLVNKAEEKGNRPFGKTWDLLASGYIKADNLPMAVKTMKGAFMAQQPGWKPNLETLGSCLVYLKQQGDMEESEEFVSLLGAAGHLPSNGCKRLQDYMHNRTDEFYMSMSGDEDGSDSDDENLKETDSGEGTDADAKETA